MKFNKTIKKIFAAIMAFTMIFGIMNITGGKTTAKASTSPVQMYCTEHNINRRGYLQYYVYIQIDANSAKNKEVYVHHSSSGGWIDTAANFLTKLDNNVEIWKADISGFGVSDFTIKYVGDGITYWDNNNGNNYTYTDIIGTAYVKAQRRTSYYSSTISAVVKNIGYDKKVKVRYTLDNWNTYNDVYMSYTNTNYGINGELWYVNLDSSLITEDGFQFCICYEVNGQTYWDNNFGQNYDKSYYSPT